MSFVLLRRAALLHLGAVALTGCLALETGYVSTRDTAVSRQIESAIGGDLDGGFLRIGVHLTAGSELGVSGDYFFTLGPQVDVTYLLDARVESYGFNFRIDASIWPERDIHASAGLTAAWSKHNIDGFPDYDGLGSELSLGRRGDGCALHWACSP